MLRSFALTLLLLILSPSARAQDAAATENLLQEASQWLSSAFEQQRVRLTIQPLQLDDESYRQFVQRRLTEKDAAHVGDVALAAQFEANGQKNGRAGAICYLLYSPKQHEQLKTQFFRFHPSLEATATFLVAHETAHCLEHLFPTTPPPAGASQRDRERWSETQADAYAGMIALLSQQDGQILNSIMTGRNRYAKNSSHDSAEALSAIWNDPEIITDYSRLTLKDLWILTDKLRSKHFKQTR